MRLELFTSSTTTSLLYGLIINRPERFVKRGKQKNLNFFRRDILAGFWLPMQNFTKV